MSVLRALLMKVKMDLFRPNFRTNMKVSILVLVYYSHVQRDAVKTFVMPIIQVNQQVVQIKKGDRVQNIVLL